VIDRTRWDPVREQNPIRGASQGVGTSRPTSLGHPTAQDLLSAAMSG